MIFNRDGSLSESRPADRVGNLQNEVRALNPGAVTANLRRRNLLSCDALRLLTSAATRVAVPGKKSVRFFK